MLKLTKITLAIGISTALTACFSDDKRSDNSISEPSISSITLSKVSSFSTGYGEGSTEILDFDKKTNKLAVTHAGEKALQTLNLTNDNGSLTISSDGDIDLSTLSSTKIAAPNSVSTFNGKAAVAVEIKSSDGTQSTGTVAVYDLESLQLLEQFDVGFLPDMVTFTPDGAKIIVANEGEPNSDYSIDPEGSISIIDMTTKVVSHITFNNVTLDSKTRFVEKKNIRGTNVTSTIAQDLEPEYVTVSEDGKTAWVSLQENNALATINLVSNSLTSIQGLGTKNYSLNNNAIDASDKDDTLTVTAWPNLVGMYMPDAISAFTINGTNYIATANEGDGREYFFDVADEAECDARGGLDYDKDDGCLAYIDESRVKDIDDFDLTFSSALNQAMINFGQADFEDSEALGRLKISVEDGVNVNGEIETIHSYGARSFSIWDESGNLVFDSGNEFREQIVASIGVDNYVELNDGRSDDKGVEPESIVVKKIANKTFAFIGLERDSGLMVYDVSTPAASRFIQYIPATDGDVAPEGLEFVSAEDSPSGKALLLVSYEVSGSIAAYEVTTVK